MNLFKAQSTCCEGLGWVAYFLQHCRHNTALHGYDAIRCKDARCKQQKASVACWQACLNLSFASESALLVDSSCSDTRKPQVLLARETVFTLATWVGCKPAAEFFSFRSCPCCVILPSCLMVFESNTLQRYTSPSLQKQILANKFVLVSPSSFVFISSIQQTGSLRKCSSVTSPERFKKELF